MFTVMVKFGQSWEIVGNVAMNEVEARNVAKFWTGRANGIKTLKNGEMVGA